MKSKPVFRYTNSMWKRLRNSVKRAKKLDQPAEDVLSMGADFRQRRLYLIGEVDEGMAYRFMVAFQRMDATPGSITVVINSGGGAVIAGFAIYDVLMMRNNFVEMHAYGAAMSMAALIFQAADVRLMTPQCSFMLHAGSIDMDGEIDVKAMVAIAREIDRNNIRYERLMADRTGLPLPKIHTYCQGESYFTAEEAITEGFADGLLTAEESVALKLRRT